MNHVTSLFAIICFALALSAQVPTNVRLQILKAEDARRYDKTLEDLMKSPNADIRTRAALAAGRIGREEAIPPLTTLLTNDPSEKVRVIAAFALGEIESTKAADAILNAIKTLETPAQKAETRPVGSVPHLTARLVEAAGKIAAANANAPQVRALQISIFDQLNAQAALGVRRNYQITLLDLTAALRAKPEGVDIVVAKFLSDPDARIRADALNTLARLRSKQSLPEIRSLLGREADPIVRANAARVLGAAEDKESIDTILTVALNDIDSRVRISAIRALANIKEPKVAKNLLDRLSYLLSLLLERAKTHGLVQLEERPSEKNEILELVTTTGRLLAGTHQREAIDFLRQLIIWDQGYSPEIDLAFVRIDPIKADGKYTDRKNWKQISSFLQMLGEIAANNEKGTDIENVKKESVKTLQDICVFYVWNSTLVNENEFSLLKATPDALRAFAAYKTDTLNEVLLRSLNSRNVFIRATTAELSSYQPKSEEIIMALKAAFIKALITDKHDNDAQLAILDALYKLDKRESVGTLLSALNATDYLVRKKAFELLSDKDLQKDVPSLASLLEEARKAGKDQVLPYNPKSGTKLGQVLNTDADYRRALARKNGSVKAVLTTEKGTFTIDFYPEQAPLTVDNFIKLARSKYFDGLEVHRVVPNFVMQDGDPRGDGNGGPGWSIRCEVNMLPYDRGAVGMALSGKDTGGSQWFVTHSPQPHLDGGYTVFGRVSETDMKVVDNIVRGDKILSVKIMGR